MESGYTKVMKFGGESMDDLNQVGVVVDQEGVDSQQVLVVSAFSEVTNKLLGIAEKIETEGLDTFALIYPLFQGILEEHIAKVPSYEQADMQRYLSDYIRNIVLEIVGALSQFRPDARKGDKILYEYVKDRCISAGEVFSSRVAATVLSTRSGVKKFTQIDLSDLLQGKNGTSFTGFNHGAERETKQDLRVRIVLGIRERIAAVIEQDEVPILTGYVGLVPKGILSRMGRSYTDSVAAGAAIAITQEVGEEKIMYQNWKKVDGIMSADPRIVGEDNADLQREISYRELAELASTGMKAVNADAASWLRGTRIVTQIRNIFNPTAPGTLVTSEGDKDASGVRVISTGAKRTIIPIVCLDMDDKLGVIGDIGNVCREFGVSIKAVSDSKTAFNLVIDRDCPRLAELKVALSAFGEVEVVDDPVVELACVGGKMRHQVGVLSKLSGILSDNGINIYLPTGDMDVNTGFIIAEKDAKRAIQVLHHGLFGKGRVDAVTA